MVSYNLPGISVNPYFYGSVVQANPAATTMVLNCPVVEGLEGCENADGITITVGPWATLANHGGGSGTFDMSLAMRVEPDAIFTNEMDPDSNGPQTLTASVHCAISAGSAVLCTTSTAHHPINEPSPVIPSNSSTPASVPAATTSNLWPEWEPTATREVGATAVATYTKPPASIFGMQEVSISVTAGMKALATTTTTTSGAVATKTTTKGAVATTTTTSGAGSKGVNVAGVVVGLGFCLYQVVGAF